MNKISLFRCLSDPTRLAIIERLCDQEECSVTQLVELTKQERTNVSHHLAQLRTCGLVRTRHDGARVLYGMAHTTLGDLIEKSGQLVEHIQSVGPQVCVDEGCC